MKQIPLSISAAGQGRLFSRRPDIAKEFIARFPQAKEQKVSVSLENLDADSLLKELNSTQPPFDIYGSDKNDQSEPWLRHRFSYYELQQEQSSDISVYAVWALGSIAKQELWIEALTEQFKKLNSDIVDLYIVLHDKDFGKTSFSIVEPKHVIPETKINRTVAVFAHVDEIGKHVLGKKGITAQTIYDIIKEILEKKQKRECLFSIIQCLTCLEDANTLSDKLSLIEKIDCEYFQRLKSIIDSMNQSEKGSEERALKVYNAIYEINSMIGVLENN